MRALKTITLSTTLLLLSSGAVATAEPEEVVSVYSMIAEMRTESRNDALTIKEVFAPYLDNTVFETRDDLLRALESGELVRLTEPHRYNLQPRLSGQSFIGQKDMEYQDIYVAARPATIGMLMEIGRRVERGPLDITSLVRSSEYQRMLQRGNGNANTDVPTHTMGYAVDIGLKEAPPETLTDLRAVLEEMRDAGDIYFIGERNQLTFHIVPVPARFQHFEQRYRELIAEQQAAAAQTPAYVPPAPPPPPQQGPVSRLWSWLTALVD